MKKTIVFVLITLFVIGISSAFAGEGPESPGVSSGDDNLLKRASETITDEKNWTLNSEKNKIKLAKDFDAFQLMSNEIQEGAANARGLSLRKNKEELLKRRMNK